MSADNWAVCPRCYYNAMEKWTKNLADIRSKYGLIEEEKYLALLNEADSNLVIQEDYRTFREDYEFYVPENEYGKANLYISFSGECQVCDLSYSFEDKKHFWKAES